ncbi:MAG: DUF177 domain-containing protein [Candidatus Hydrogenedentes bacterium]|nr:DUF177 domain-containing protein [Candidatus Hydrogenedentota bacterium]
MSSLEIQLIFVTERGFRLDVTLDVNSLRPEGVEALPMGEVTVRGTLTPMIGQYLFQGTVEGVFSQPCARCLEPAEVPVSLPVVWTFEEGPAENRRRDDDDDEVVDEVEDEAYGLYAYQGTSLSLAWPVWTEVALALPVKFVCREDCRGLCPVCGGNRNSAPCTCPEEVIEETPVQNSGFAGLKDLFPDLPK